jgi:potassium-dependent mechanosensitive channel
MTLRILFSAILLVLCGFHFNVLAAENLSHAELISQWKSRLDEISKQLELKGQSDQSLRTLRTNLDELQQQTSKSIELLTSELESAREELETLGAVSEEQKLLEPEVIKAERQRVDKIIGDIEARLKEIELIEVRTSRLIEEILHTRREQFSNKILVSGPSPLSIAVWKSAAPQFIDAYHVISQSIKDLYVSTPVDSYVRESVFAIAIAAIIALVFAIPLYKFLLKKYGRDPAIRQPDFLQAIRAMLVVGAVRALLPTAVAILIYIVAINTALFTPDSLEFAKAIFLGFIFFTWVVAFFRASLSPHYSAWRVVPVADHFAKGVWPFIVILSLIYALDIMLTEAFVVFGARLEITILRDFFISSTVLFLIVAMLLRQDMWLSSKVEAKKPMWRTLRILFTIVLMFFILVGVLGYVALMKLVATQVLLSGGLLYLLILLHRLGREFISQMTVGENWIAVQLRDYMHFDQDTTRRVEFWFALAFDILLVVGGTLCALFIWGASYDDVSRWAYKALFGFELGRIRLSFLDIFIAALVFVAIVMATRFIQKLLAEKVLPQTKLDIGIRESLRQACGYLGYLIAIIVGIAALGLDMSNFALVASALTVGIGFGLQNVVNNFVSGLILLIERPVKVGDWIVVGDQQGLVKRIRVRATEIITFDRSSVFIPNSELISGTVTNWTHADKMGRIIIPVGVAYGSDTELVKDTLLKVADAHEHVLKDPAPVAIFRGFGDSSLDFELRCVLEDVEGTIKVTSDLCFEIDKAFRKADIEIPFPQQDIYIKQMPDQS